MYLSLLQTTEPTPWHKLSGVMTVRTDVNPILTVVVVIITAYPFVAEKLTIRDRAFTLDRV